MTKKHSFVWLACLFSVVHFILLNVCKNILKRSNNDKGLRCKDGMSFDSTYLHVSCRNRKLGRAEMVALTLLTVLLTVPTELTLITLGVNIMHPQ